MWALVVVIALVLVAVVILVVFAFAALVRANATTTAGRADDAEAYRETLGLVIAAAHDDRDAFLRAVIAKHAGEQGALVARDQAVAVAEQHTRFAEALDPTADDYKDPETGEAIRLAGMSA